MKNADTTLILVVDDQPANVQAVAALLARDGYDVMPALSGEQALERSAKRLPSLVLLDMRMPRMDGFEVCARLREDPRTADVPVIFLTAAHERETLVEAFRKGAVDYVTKPFVAEELLARVRTHLELKRARDHLALLAQERADLTQIVAHDLKNPLAGILFALDMVERGGPELEEGVRNIRGSVDRCLSFIDNYLGRWANSQEQRSVELAPMRFGAVLKASVRDLELNAQRKNMRIGLAVEDDPEVIGNPTAVRHVIDNLLSNALRYAPEDTAIDVRCAVGRSGMTVVSVSDRGPGVPAERRPQLFKRYSRGDGSDTVQHSSGLGLAISKEEIERMNGHIWYSDRDGGGAVFSFVLPAAEGEPLR
ncbi:MAG: hybrid sensor histidine kinase/response regulator [Gammaproteobacteria bacterium]|nr:hybrid sensor histidine kinase/response regulator [Gammaproteobacteria bacterium]